MFTFHMILEHGICFTPGPTTIRLATFQVPSGDMHMAGGWCGSSGLYLDVVMSPGIPSVF